LSPNFWLAWAAIDVPVLFQHQDFLGDFHRDRIHPAVPGAMDELWLLTGLSG